MTEHHRSIRIHCSIQSLGQDLHRCSLEMCSSSTRGLAGNEKPCAMLRWWRGFSYERVRLLCVVFLYGPSASSPFSEQNCFSNSVSHVLAHGRGLFPGEQAHHTKYDTHVDTDLLTHDPAEASKLTFVGISYSFSNSGMCWSMGVDS